MNFIKRAFTSIKRNLGKTCLLFLIVLILCSVISGTISADQAAENTERNMFNNMLTITRLEFDWWALREAEDVDPDDWHWMPDPALVTELTPDMIREIAALPYVETYDFFVRVWDLWTLDIEMYDPPSPEGMGGGMWVDENELGIRFGVRGVQNPNIFDIQQGLLELVHGRVFTEYEIENPSNVILISEGLAEQNGLTVGSTISFRNIFFAPQLDMMWDPGHQSEENILADETYNVEVVGIFRLAAPPDRGDPWSNWNFAWEIGNRIYAPNSFAINANLFQARAQLEHATDDWEWHIREDGTQMEPEDMIWIEHFFSLYNPNDFPAFREAVAESLPHFLVIDAGGGLQGVSSALASMRSLTQTILWLAVGASLLILTLLITLFLRDRKREVGIYLALGEKKRKLVSQFVVEVMVIAFISIVVALFAGNILAATLSENMLISDLAADEDDRGGHSWDLWEDNPFMWDGYMQVVDTDEIIASYDVSLTPMTILLFFAIGLGTTLIATIIPMIYVVRLNPKKIMM